MSTLNTCFLTTGIQILNSGIGISFVSHQETFTKYSLNQLNVNWTYDVQINYDWNFRPSVSFGYATKDFGFDNIIFEDQINIYQNIISLTLMIQLPWKKILGILILVHHF